MKNLYLTNELRKSFKKIFGFPIFGNKKEVFRKFKKFLKKENFKKVITVGDVCSLYLPSDVKIFDGKKERNKKISLQNYFFSFENPPGAIDRISWKILKKAISQKKNVFVKGEEDLLVIPAVLLAENNSLVVYGLPKKGISLIKVNPENKKIFKEILKGFKKGKFKKIVFGGTFDRLHEGHKYFLSMAKYYAKEAIVGITSDEFVKRRKKIQKFEIRKRNVEKFLKKIKLKNQIYKISDIYGPAIWRKDIEAILLTEETFENGEKINRERKKRGLKELNYFILPYLLDEKGEKISSSKIRAKLSLKYEQ